MLDLWFVSQLHKELEESLETGRKLEATEASLEQAERTLEHTQQLLSGSERDKTHAEQKFALAVEQAEQATRGSEQVRARAWSSLMPHLIRANMIEASL